MADRLELGGKRKVKAVIVQSGHKTVQFSLDIETNEGETDLASFEGSLRKKSKNIAHRLDTALEVSYERQSVDMEWEVIGDESPLKNGETVQVFLIDSVAPVQKGNSENIFSTETHPSQSHVRKIFDQDDTCTGNSLCFIMFMFQVNQLSLTIDSQCDMANEEGHHMNISNNRPQLVPLTTGSQIELLYVLDPSRSLIQRG
jgi:hypothetical protein